MINLPGDPYLEGKSIEEFFKCQQIGAIKLVRVFTGQFPLYSPVHNPLIADVMINAVINAVLGRKLRNLSISSI